MSPSAPRYLRVVVTTRCPLACAYCHHEGDPSSDTAPMSTDDLTNIVLAGIDTGIRKLKLLGGEPLVRADLPDVVARWRAEAPSLDISVVTSGTVPLARLDALFAAGLSRANLSIHGWAPSAFAKRRGNDKMRAMRAEVLARLLEMGRPLKLNYVYGSPEDLDDLGAFLDWAAGKPLVVNVLDDLGRDLGPSAVRAAVEQLRGRATRSWREPDPDSLDTQRLSWDDGLVIEIKDQQLGVLAPWTACATCPVRKRCKEGIHAVRLTHDGRLRPCMDRADLGIPMRPVLRAGGRSAVAAAWREWTAQACATEACA